MHFKRIVLWTSSSLICTSSSSRSKLSSYWSHLSPVWYLPSFPNAPSGNSASCSCIDLVSSSSTSRGLRLQVSGHGSCDCHASRAGPNLHRSTVISVSLILCCSLGRRSWLTRLLHVLVVQPRVSEQQRLTIFRRQKPVKNVMRVNRCQM